MTAIQDAPALAKIRTDVVGSLLRPEAVKAARIGFDEGKIAQAELQRIEDDAVRDAVRLQEAAGLDVVTDGELRRLNFQDSFGASVEGYDANRSTLKVYEQRVEGAAPGRRWDIAQMHDVGTAVSHRRPAKARLKLAHNIPLDEYRFVSKVAKAPAKVSLIGPDRIAQRFAWEKSKAVYSGLDEFIADVVAIQRKMIQELVDAGCHYVHMDAPGFTAYVDKVSLERMKARGEDPDQNLDRAIRAENAVIEGFPGVTFGLHICRGNPRGVDSSGKVQAQWHREGHYDSIAEKLFGQLKHQRLLLEYDSERAGSFDVLRFVRKGTVAVLGVVTTKSEEIEQVDAMKRRVEMAAKYLPVEQLAVSPQCGFSSGIGVPQLSEDAEWAKFEILIKTAEAVWGHV
jgi:5-methyltetrahydropteroyltriglutamate--homocysteine methyltransferase